MIFSQLFRKTAFSGMKSREGDKHAEAGGVGRKEMNQVNKNRQACSSSQSIRHSLRSYKRMGDGMVLDLPTSSSRCYLPCSMSSRLFVQFDEKCVREIDSEMNELFPLPSLVASSYLLRVGACHCTVDCCAQEV